MQTAQEFIKSLASLSAMLSLTESSVNLLNLKLFSLSTHFELSKSMSFIVKVPKNKFTLNILANFYLSPDVKALNALLSPTKELTNTLSSPPKKSEGFF